MPQAIAGVSPPEIRETTIMTVWPTLGAHPVGRLLGRLYRIDIGPGMFTIGKLIALLSIPVALPLFFLMVNPLTGRRYTLTNRRVIIQRGSRLHNERWVELNRFDSIEVVVQPGQEWYPAGDLIFRNGAIETFRLEGVSRPETFKRTCIKARMGYVGAHNATAS
jgi:hypothetical protein